MVIVSTSLYICAVYCFTFSSSFLFFLFYLIVCVLLAQWLFWLNYFGQKFNSYVFFHIFGSRLLVFHINYVVPCYSRNTQNSFLHLLFNYFSLVRQVIINFNSDSTIWLLLLCWIPGWCSELRNPNIKLLILLVNTLSNYSELFIAKIEKPCVKSTLLVSKGIKKVLLIRQRRLTDHYQVVISCF